MSDINDALERQAAEHLQAAKRLAERSTWEEILEMAKPFGKLAVVLALKYLESSLTDES